MVSVQHSQCLSVMDIEFLSNLIMDGVTFWQKEVQRAYTEETLPPLLTAIEKLLVENKGGDGFFVGDEVNYVDSLCVVVHLLFHFKNKFA